MSRPQLFGNLPVVRFGTNKGRLDRERTRLQFSLTKEELYKAYNNWIQVFRIKGSTLTFEQYLLKLKEAKISPLELGNKGDQYHLARYNDEGGYTDESCRFIPKKFNSDEQKRAIIYESMLTKYGKKKTHSILRGNARKKKSNG